MITDTLAREKEFDTLIYEAEKLCERRNPEALTLIDRVAEIAAGSGEIKHQILLNYIQADYDCFVLNNYDLAIKKLNAALVDVEDQDYPDFDYKLYMTLGNACQLKGDLFSAQEVYFKGLKSLLARKNLHHNEKVFLAAFYYNISIVLSSSELKIESEGYLENAISIYSELNHKFKLSKCYVAYAQLLERRGEYRQAIDYLHRALQIDTESNDGWSIAVSKANLGVLSIKTAEYEQAFTYLQEALEYFEENKIMYETGMVKLELGQALVQYGTIERGLEYLTEAEELMISIDNKKELSELFKVKAEVLKKQGQYELANEYLEKYIESLKFFFDNEKTNALARAKKEFESEQKEKEAQLLRLKNEEIQEYVRKLEISNNELRQFAHVTSHDLREPLRMIRSYLSLLRKSLPDRLSDQQNEFLGYVMDGAKRMDLLIQDLLHLAKVDANPRVEKVKLSSVMEEIKLNLDTAIREKRAVIHISALPVLIADRTQMLQLFQNLISNGIKYNKSAIPEVRVKYLDKGDHIEFTVADNGIGIPGHLREEAFQIFKRLHQQGSESGSGIGLSICKKIVERMGGTIKIEDGKTGGTVFRISLSKTVVQPEAL